MQKERLKDKERLQEARVAVFNELDPLQEVVMWGEPSTEALLGQLMPMSVSLFFSKYDVSQAREEFGRMQQMIEDHGAKTIRFKDRYAEILLNKPAPADLPGSISELKERIIQKGYDLYKKYEDEIHEEEKRTEVIVNPADVLKNVGKIIDAELAYYDENDPDREQKVIRLNYELSLAHEKPLANIIYARDQSNAFGNHIVLSRMRWDIRQPEVPIYKEVYESLGYKDKLVEIDNGTLEGGDGMIIDGICYIGVGARTSLEAVKEIAMKIGDNLRENKIGIVAVVNEKHASETAGFTRPAQEHMQVMHLDTFYGPLAHNLSLGLIKELKGRKCVGLVKQGSHIETLDLGNFYEFITHKTETDVIGITDKDQENYATNSLNDGRGGLIAALERNREVKTNIENTGRVMVDSPNIEALVGGFGAVHCMTASIVRG